MGLGSSKFFINTRLDGKTAVITGCNTGIGKVTAKEFYRIGCRVIMACRDVNRTTVAMDEIKKELEETKNVGELIIYKLDLGSLESVKECANQILEKEKNIHLLINNAGIMTCPKGKTVDGFETQFGVNHLGHFLFTKLLLPKIIESTPARIVNVSSLAHERGKINFDDLNWEKRRYSAIGAYQQSKLANVLFTAELAKRLKDTGVTVYALHPGVVKTELGRYMDDTYFRGVRQMSSVFMRAVGKTPEEGAQTTLYCALDEQVGNKTGLYYSDCKEKLACAEARNPEIAEKLWEESEKLVANFL